LAAKPNNNISGRPAGQDTCDRIAGPFYSRWARHWAGVSRGRTRVHLLQSDRRRYPFGEPV